jgi:hypothetical protein
VRPLIREPAFGEALDAGKLEQLGRYEVRLDRKLERMLAMLLRLKDPPAGGDRDHDIKSRIFDAAMRRLLNAGRIRIETSGPPSRQRSALVLGENS